MVGAKCIIPGPRPHCLRSASSLLFCSSLFAPRYIYRYFTANYDLALVSAPTIFALLSSSAVCNTYTYIVINKIALQSPLDVLALGGDAFFACTAMCNIKNSRIQLNKISDRYVTAFGEFIKIKNFFFFTLLVNPSTSQGNGSCNIYVNIYEI